MSLLQKVCVTGANGYIASHLVQQLLASGKYDVVGTVRGDPTDAKKVGHLLKLPGAESRLKLHSADLLKAGSFAASVKNCTYVFHTASPFFVAPSAGRDYCEAEFMGPAIEGTLNLLRSCLEEKSVKRVVLTSSTASIYCRNGLSGDHKYTEADWSVTETMKEKKDWYALSKTLAERSAWDFVKTQGANCSFKLVVINPSLVMFFFFFSFLACCWVVLLFVLFEVSVLSLLRHIFFVVLIFLTFRVCFYVLNRCGAPCFSQI